VFKGTKTNPIEINSHKGLQGSPPPPNPLQPPVVVSHQTPLTEGVSVQTQRIEPETGGEKR